MRNILRWNKFQSKYFSFCWRSSLEILHSIISHFEEKIESNIKKEISFKPIFMTTNCYLLPHLQYQSTWDPISNKRGGYKLSHDSKDFSVCGYIQKKKIRNKKRRAHKWKRYSISVRDFKRALPRSHKLDNMFRISHASAFILTELHMFWFLFSPSMLTFYWLFPSHWFYLYWNSSEIDLSGKKERRKKKKNYSNKGIYFHEWNETCESDFHTVSLKQTYKDGNTCAVFLKLKKGNEYILRLNILVALRICFKVIFSKKAKTCFFSCFFGEEKKSVD